MKESKKSEFIKAKTFLTRLQATVQCLPTQSEKAQAVEKIAALAEFLKTLQGAVDALPSTEEAERVDEALSWLQTLLSKAEANPVLAGLVPSPRPARPRKTSPGVSEQGLAAARSDLETLKTLSVEELRSRLSDEKGYSLPRIRAMAAALGVSATEKLSRESLAHQVTTKIANYRGYQALSGKSESV